MQINCDKKNSDEESTLNFILHWHKTRSKLQIKIKKKAKNSNLGVLQKKKP